MGTRSLTLVMVMLTLSAAPGAAQTALDGTIRGYVKDEQGAVLPGATVSAASESVAGVHTAVTDGEGFYRLLNLAPGTYALSAELEGFAKYRQDAVVVRAGLNLGINITLQVGALTETVNVTLDTPMLEVSSAAQGVNISGDFQRSVPISGRRHWGDFMRLVPGVVSGDASVYQGGFHYVHGADSQSNAIQLDGVDVASSQQATTIYIGLSDETIADVQVKTAAMDASSPLAQGAVISVVSQSGTNQLRGALGISLLPLGWIGDNNPGGTSTKVGVFQPDAALGGPILRDRLWFFGSYRRVYNEATVSRTAEQLSTLQSFDSSFEPFNNISETNFYFVKGTAQFSPRHQSYVFYNYDFLPADLNSYVHLVPTGRQWIGGKAVGGRLTSVWRDSLTTRIVAGYNDKAFESGSTDDREPSRSVHRSSFPSAGILRGSGAVVYLGAGGLRNVQPADKLSLSIGSTYYKTGWGGSHELQAGMLYQKHTYETSSLYPANGFALEELVMRDPTDPAAGLLPFHRQVYEETLNVSSRSQFGDLGLYLQDAWRPMPRVTLNAGLRVDRVTRRDRIIDIDIDIQDSVEVGPRLGLNYVLTADQRNTIRASWGRVHDTPTINKASGATNTLAVHDLYDVNLDGIFELDLLTPGGASAPPNRVIDPDYHQQYMNEWTLGFRRQLPGRTTLDAAFIHRDYRDRTTLVDQNGIYDGDVFQGYQNPALNEIYLLTNNRWNWPAYSGLEVQATKQTERWQVLGALTRQWRHIDGTWQPNDPASFIQPDAFASDRGIGGVYSPTSVAQDANSLSGTHMTSNISFADYVVRTAMSFRGPWGLLLATNYIVRAGAWSGPVVTRIAAPDPRFGPPTVQLSNGRVVSNPLATTVRFAYPTRGEGQFRAPTVHHWNLRIGRDFPVGAYRLETALDVFNVPNSDGDELFVSGANQTYSPNYRLTGTRQQPRGAQLLVRFKF